MDLHRNDQNIHELIELLNDLSLNIGKDNNKEGFDNMEKKTAVDREHIRKERRFKILSFDYDEILDLLTISSDHYMRIKRVVLPDGFYADSVHYDPSNRSFDFIIGSEKFPSIPEFGRIPYCSEEIEYSVIELNRNKDFRIIDKNRGIQE